MSVDVDLLQSMDSFEDERSGIRERFLTPQIGGGSSYAVLSEPLKDPHPIAWVLCHSFGLEQIGLLSAEVPVARALSAAGFPVLRFHAQGYGDSELPVEQVSLASHVRDTLDAVAVLERTTGLSRVGLMGARFGAAVAALAADRIGAAALALWDPAISGRTYLRGLMRQSTLSDVASAHAGRKIETPQEREQELSAAGIVDLQGVPLTREAFEELSSMDLRSDLGSFNGESLIVQITASAEIRSPVASLAERLRELGGECSVEVIADSWARTFGSQRFRPSADRTHKIDTQLGITNRLTELTVAWSQSLSGLATTQSRGGHV
jgi:pimeloyl-ACP methyl ester carboxylesterase